MSVQTMEAIIADYVTAIGKHPEELKEVRVVSAPDKPAGPIAWDVELVFGNEHVTYTRVARFWLNEHIQYKSITQKTRLWVPLQEVPEGAKFYWAGDRYRKKTLGHNVVAGEHHLGNHAYLAPEQTVECEFYYARGEGAMAGGHLWVPETDLLHYCGPRGLEYRVNGCKFDFWADCYYIATGRRSKFS